MLHRAVRTMCVNTLDKTMLTPGIQNSANEADNMSTIVPRSLGSSKATRFVLFHLENLAADQMAMAKAATQKIKNNMLNDDVV